MTIVHPFLAYEPTYDPEIFIERLLAAGVPETDIQLIRGHAIKDARDAPVGNFAGTATADALTVGSYANIAHSGREGTGTFAGDPDTQRRGSFGDTDRDTVTTYRAGVKRTRVASHRKLKQMLVDAGLDEATATAHVDALLAGHALVLVGGESTLDDIAAVIDELDQAHSVQQTLRAAA